jgi:hypothetical protein
MTGERKYRFALYGLGAICAGFGVAAWRQVAEALFSEFAWAVVGIVVAFGVPNVGEHVAQALKARRLPAGEAK